MSRDYEPLAFPPELVENVRELEEFKEKRRGTLDKARDYGAERLAEMSPQVMDVLQHALQSEDEGLRVKAALALFDRLVPKMRARNEEAEEIIEIVPESRKRLLEDIEEEMRKKLGG